MKKILVDEAVLKVVLETLSKGSNVNTTEWHQAIHTLSAALVQVQEPIGEIVCIDYSSEENGPEAIVALHQEVELGAMLYAAISLNSNSVTDM